MPSDDKEANGWVSVSCFKNFLMATPFFTGIAFGIAVISCFYVFVNVDAVVTEFAKFDFDATAARDWLMIGLIGIGTFDFIIVILSVATSDYCMEKHCNNCNKHRIIEFLVNELQLLIFVIVWIIGVCLVISGFGQTLIMTIGASLYGACALDKPLIQAAIDSGITAEATLNAVATHTNAMTDSMVATAHYAKDWGFLAIFMNEDAFKAFRDAVKAHVQKFCAAAEKDIAAPLLDCWFAFILLVIAQVTITVSARGNYVALVTKERADAALTKRSSHV